MSFHNKQKEKKHLTCLPALLRFAITVFFSRKFIPASISKEWMFVKMSIEDIFIYVHT